MSHTNLRTINSTEINNSGAFRVGDNLSSGTTGQVLKSNGDYIAPSWETDIDTTYQGSATIDIDTTTDPDTINVIKVPNDLTISQNGTIIDTFNGSVVKTIDLEGKYTAGCGIDISGHPVPHIEADTDEVTITHNLAGAEQLSVLKVPNTLTFTGYDTGTYDGSSALSINLVDTDTTYQGSATIDIDTTTDPDTINVIKVPNTLTFTGYDTGTFDGSSALSINLVDTDTTYTAGNGIQISGSNIIQTRTDNQTIRDSGGGSGNNLEVIKVPNTLTFTGYDTGTYDGSSALSINLVDTDTTYQGSVTIDIDTTTTPDTINVLKVPNTLTFTGYASGTYNGSSPLSINLTDNQLNLLAGSGIIINNTGGFNRIITADIDNNTLGWTPPSPNKQIEVRKVPNTLTFTGYATGTFDGSSALSINLVDTDTTYQGGTGISINTGTTPHTINASNIPNSALQNSTISGISLGGNLATLTFYDSKGAFITSYNGANPPTSITLDGDTTYKGSATINIDTTTAPDTINVIKVPNTLSAGNNLSYSSGTTYDGSVSRTINLDSNISNIDTISFRSTPSATALIGNTYPSNPTPLLYCDLSSTTNIIPGAVLATKIQRTSVLKSFTNIYSEFSRNFRTSFKAQSANVMVEFRAIVRADNKVFYGGLYDYNAGVYNTDTRNRFNYNDETDQDHTVLTWWMRNLTPGNTYYISPYFRGSASTVYIYAGHNGSTDGFAPAIMRIIDGGNNVSIY